MIATLHLISRKKHPIKNSNLKSRSFRYGYLLLSLCFLFLATIPVFAVDEFGNVVVHSDYFSCHDIDAYDSSMNFLFSKDSSVISSGIFTREVYNSTFFFNGIYSFYPNFYTDSSFPSVNDFNYLTVSVDVAVLSPYVLVELSELIFYTYDSNYSVNLTDNVNGIVINYAGRDRAGVNITYLVDISSLPFDFQDLINIVPKFSLRSTVSSTLLFLLSDLKIEYYKNYQDVIADVNSNVQQIINQNDVIINNLNEVKGQLNNIHNSLSSDKNPDNPELDSELSDANQIEQDFKDKFQDFVDLDKIDRVENIITDWTNNSKILSSFIFVRNVLDLLFDEVPILSILFSVGSACIILTMLFGIVSHSFRSPSGNVAQDPRSYTFNYIMFSNLSQQQTLSSKKADFHAFEKFDGSWGV